MAVRDDFGFHRVICQANYVAHPSDLVEHRQNGTDPAEADARLISAAPELLECLIDAVEIMDDQLDGDFPEPMATFRAAIAKATGA